MKLIKRILVKVIQALVIFAVVYAVIDGFDRSAAFNDERIAEHKASCHQAKNVDSEGGIYHEEKQ